MGQPVTGGAQTGQIVGVIRSTFSARDDVMDLQIAGIVAAGPGAFVAVFRKNFAACFGRDGGLVALVWAAGLAITGGCFQFQRADFQFAFAGLHRGYFAVRALVDVDLRRR